MSSDTDTKSTVRDWQGFEVFDEEPDDKLVEVWRIEPSTDYDFDYVLVRGWQDALEYAQNAIEWAAERHTREELLDGENASVEMGLTTMRLGEYRALQKDNNE